MRTVVMTLVALVALSSMAMAGVIVERENVADGKYYSSGGNGDAIWTYPTPLATGRVYLLSQFDISDVGSTVNSATLDLLIRGGSGALTGTIFDVYAMVNGNEDWDEATYTGSTKDGTNAWSSVGAALADTSAVGSLTFDTVAGYDEKAIQIDVTSVLQLMANEGRTKGTFIVTCSTSASNYTGPIRIAVKEITGVRDGFGTQLLSVNSVPEPATMGLLAIGALGLLRRKR